MALRPKLRAPAAWDGGPGGARPRGDGRCAGMRFAARCGFHFCAAMDAHLEIYRRLSKIENELVQAVQASAVVRGVAEELRACLHRLSEESQQARALHLRNQDEALALALRELEALAEQACQLADCRDGDARRVLLPGLEEARQDIRDLCHQLGLHRRGAAAEQRAAP